MFIFRIDRIPKRDTRELQSAMFMFERKDYLFNKQKGEIKEQSFSLNFLVNIKLLHVLIL